jgi:hypothetical protein
MIMMVTHPTTTKIKGTANDVLSMTAQVLSHRGNIKPVSSKTTMCSTRAAMECIAYCSQKRQADKINATRMCTYKQVLDMGDIGVIYVQPKMRNSCYHPFLPVMVTGMKISGTTNHITYMLRT